MENIVDWDGRQYLVSITPKVFQWSDWESSIPREIDRDLYYIEEKTEYCFRIREKETYEKDYKSVLGNYVRTDISYGQWSGWQNDYIYSVLAILSLGMSDDISQPHTRNKAAFLTVHEEKWS